jgi:hypothetical protein
MDTKTNKSAVLSAFAIALMAVSIFLLDWTVNTLVYLIELGGVFFLWRCLLSFMYVAGAAWMGRIIT